MRIVLNSYSSSENFCFRGKDQRVVSVRIKRRFSDYKRTEDGKRNWRKKTRRKLFNLLEWRDELPLAGGRSGESWPGFRPEQVFFWHREGLNRKCGEAPEAQQNGDLGRRKTLINFPRNFIENSEYHNGNSTLHSHGQVILVQLCRFVGSSGSCYWFSVWVAASCVRFGLNWLYPLLQHRL